MCSVRILSIIVHDTDYKPLGDAEQASKNEALQDEIKGLRQQVSRLNDLEHELQRLQRLQENAESRNACSSKQLPSVSKEPEGKDDQLTQYPDKFYAGDNPAESEDVEAFRRRFVQCSLELERVKDARDLLAEKARRWKLTCRRLQHMILRQRSGSKRSEPTKSLPGPGSATVVKSNQCSSPHEAAGLICASNAFVASAKGKEALPALHHGSKAASIVHDDEDDMETSDESGHRSVPERLPAVPTSSEVHRKNGGLPTMQGSDSSDLAYVDSKPVGRKRNRSPTKASRRSDLVKEEILSSSPIAQRVEAGAKGVQESMDLDEISGAIYTPRKDQRKRQELYAACSYSPSIQRMWDARPSDEIPPEPRDGRIEGHNGGVASPLDEKVAEAEVPEVRDYAYYQRLGEEHAARLRDADKWQKAKERRIKQRYHNERQLAKHNSTKNMEPLAPQHRSAAAQKNIGRAHVLQPKDANIVLPRTGDTSSNKRRRTNPRSNDHGARYISLLTEDGERNLDLGNELLDDGRLDETTIPGTSAKDLGPSTNLLTEARQRRLDQLLARPSPERPRLSARNHDVGTFESHATTSRTLPEALTPETSGISRDIRSIPKSRAAPAAASAILTPNNAPNYRSPFACKPSSEKGRKSREPLLRSRPLSHLSLNDFKVNPQQNQGYDYAFKEVVRKHDQRKCLPGCTRLDCCGKYFRTMAETGLFNIFHTNRLMGSSQDDEETNMLEDFLGDEAYRLKRMSREEKAEMLLQAKTKILADHYGKHREKYAREPSPVGYWDVDMPNSQEAQEMGRMAETRNRQKVEERYREAMKKDGMWIFRDE